MKPGARPHGDTPPQEPSPLFDAAVKWAREFYEIRDAPVEDWGRWRGEPMESVMRIVWHGARIAGEPHPTKKALAERFGMSPGCTAAYNCNIPPLDHEQHALASILAMLAEPHTWIGVGCPDCGEVTPILAAGRVLTIADALTADEILEVHRVAKEGVKCPRCGHDLREGVRTPCSPPAHLDVRP